jgi:hypothetical protein
MAAMTIGRCRRGAMATSRPAESRVAAKRGRVRLTMAGMIKSFKLQV